MPGGLVLDIGAGNGYTAQRLTTGDRNVIALEPDPLMVDRSRPLIWARGVAQDLPFHDATFDAAYATWAFFFDGVGSREDGLREVRRVVKPGGAIVIVDNAGADEFCALSPRNIASDGEWWRRRGFEVTIIETAYRFDTAEEGVTLLSFYFGDEVGRSIRQTEFEYRVAVYTTRTGQA